MKVESLNASARLEDGPYAMTGMGIPDHWFEDDAEANFNTKEEFQKTFAAIIPGHSIGHEDVGEEEAEKLKQQLQLETRVRPHSFPRTLAHHPLADG